MFIKALAFLSLILSAAIFGFFFAWVCSTMWGLDALDPRVAITAMQGMNASVRNAVFAPAFFGTPLVLGVTMLVALLQHRRSVAGIFGSAALVSLLGGVVLTASIHIPMNEALALASVPDDVQSAREIWENYSPEWQYWNQMRTFFTGLVVILTGYGLARVFEVKRA